MNNPKEILKLIKMLSPQTLPRLDYIAREDLTLTNVRAGGIKVGATITPDMPCSQSATIPLGAENAHGEIEILGDVEATHWYADADGITWHFVTVGDPSKRAVCPCARLSRKLVHVPQPNARSL